MWWLISLKHKANKKVYFSKIGTLFTKDKGTSYGSFEYKQCYSTYKGHYPTTKFQKVTLSLYSALQALNNPEKGDMVAALGELTGEFALRKLRDQMKADPDGQLILQERPIIDEKTVDFDRLKDSPAGTFGRAYFEFMEGHGFSPDSRAPVRFVDDEELAYVILRYRQVHDFWHVLTGLPPSILGELALKWVELIQTGLPVCALSAVFGPLRLSQGDRILLQQKYLPWAIRTAQKSKPLMNVYYERYFNAQLDVFRKELALVQAPKHI